MILVGPLLNHSESLVTSFYIHSLRIDMLHSCSCLSPSLFFFVSFCVICLSLFSSYSQFMFLLSSCQTSKLLFTNKLLFTISLWRTIGN